MDQPVVTELIQKDLNYSNLKLELVKILDPDYERKLKQKYVELRHKLGDSGASAKTAKLIVEELQK
jgi:lipid-A-disaccharide synthase